MKYGVFICFGLVYWDIAIGVDAFWFFFSVYFYFHFLEAFCLTT